jgi:hypothetical protein
VVEVARSEDRARATLALADVPRAIGTF